MQNSQTTRRAVVTGALAASTAVAATAIGARQAVGAEAQSKAVEDSIRRQADSLALEMARRHGGRWKAKIDREGGFILIQPLKPSAGWEA